MTAIEIIERMQDRMLEHQKKYGFTSTFDFLNEDLLDLKDVLGIPEKPASKQLAYECETITDVVCREFQVNPKEVNNNRKRPNVDANKVIAKVLNLKGYSHGKIAEMVNSKRPTITARLIDYNTQYKFNKNFQSASDNVFKALEL